MLLRKQKGFGMIDPPTSVHFNFVTPTSILGDLTQERVISLSKGGTLVLITAGLIT